MATKLEVDAERPAVDLAPVPGNVLGTGLPNPYAPFGGRAEGFHFPEEGEKAQRAPTQRTALMKSSGNRAGLRRNAKKSQWEPLQLIEHLGLEVDLEEGKFRVTTARLRRTRSDGTKLIRGASRGQRLVSGPSVASANRSIWQSLRPGCAPTRAVFGAGLGATLGSEGEAQVRGLRQTRGVEVATRPEPVEQIRRCSTQARLHTDASLLTWGGVLNLKQATRGFRGGGIS
eukprot:gene11527-biopygen11835